MTSRAENLPNTVRWDFGKHILIWLFLIHNYMSLWDISAPATDNVKTDKISSLQCITRTRFLILLQDGRPRIMPCSSLSAPIDCTRSCGIEMQNENSLCELVLAWLVLPAGNLNCVSHEHMCVFMFVYAEHITSSSATLSETERELFWNAEVLAVLQVSREWRHSGRVKVLWQYAKGRSNGNRQYVTDTEIRKTNRYNVCNSFSQLERLLKSPPDCVTTELIKFSQVMSLDVSTATGTRQRNTAWQRNTWMGRLRYRNI